MDGIRGKKVQTRDSLTGEVFCKSRTRSDFVLRVPQISLGNIYEKCQGEAGGWRSLLPPSTWLTTSNYSLTSQVCEPVCACDRVNVRKSGEGRDTEKLAVMCCSSFFLLLMFWRHGAASLIFILDLPKFSTNFSPERSSRSAVMVAAGTLDRVTLASQK